MEILIPSDTQDVKMDGFFANVLEINIIPEIKIGFQKSIILMDQFKVQVSRFETQSLFLLA